MPIYEYRCTQCGEVFEILTGLSPHADPTVCKKCGGTQLEKLMSLPSFVSRVNSESPGATCCGREDRCDTPPCSGGGGCRRD